MLACLKNQVENHTKIDNSVNNQKSKTSKSDLSKAWKKIYIKHTRYHEKNNLIFTIRYYSK